jgi:alpha-D-xyloside xylohydrolase
LEIPLSAIVVDYFHWTEQGDYKFDKTLWPDVKAMADEIHEGDTKLLVSMWPTVNEKSENYRYMLNHNMLVRTARGSDRLFDFYGWQAQIDVSNPATREFVWGKLKENYVDNGVDAFWFDVSEAEIWPEHYDNLITSRGRGEMTALMYPYDYARLVYEGLQSLGREDIVTLIRGAYLGSQKYAALVWSGDISSTFESLQHQVHAALNMSMCGIPWWNTDIGGFYGGDTTSEYFRELIVRWFQFGLFCPVMRLHGSRVRHGEASNVIEPSGDPNEIWSFGERNFEIIQKILRIRENLRPYIMAQMQIASQKGWPMIRPMFFAYPQDENCWSVSDAYFFGEDILFAPITEQGCTRRKVYVPEGEWVLTKNGTTYRQGTYEIDAELHEFIAFVKKGSPILDCFKA